MKDYILRRLLRRSIAALLIGLLLPLFMLLMAWPPPVFYALF